MSDDGYGGGGDDYGYDGGGGFGDDEQPFDTEFDLGGDPDLLGADGEGLVDENGLPLVNGEVTLNGLDHDHDADMANGDAHPNGVNGDAAPH